MRRQRRVMKVFYDLRYAADHFPGIGTHAYCLLEALLDLPGEERYQVLWNPSLKQTRFDLRAIRSHPRVEWIERPFKPVNPLSVIQVGSLLRQLKPDVYLSPFYFLPAMAGCPCVLTLHDVWPLRLPGGLPFLRRMLYQLVLARAARARLIITSSAFSKREIHELSAMHGDMVRVVHLGVPPTRGRIEARKPASLPRDPFALIVGVNKPHKNLPMLAKAWALLGATPPLRLVSAGPTDTRHPRLQELCEQAGARDVTVLGRVDEDELEYLYKHATVLLFPTLYEGFGFPLVEAFEHGVAVIASDIPTLREIGDGVARFCDPTQPQAWADAITEVARNNQLRADMQDAGLKRAQTLTYAHTAAHTLDVLHEACKPDVDPS